MKGLRRAWRLLTRPRGHALWTGVVRGTGVLALLGLALVLVLPAAGPLVGFEIVTLWITGPLSPLTPVGYETILMLFGKVYPPLLVAGVAMAGSLYVEFLSYHLYGELVGLTALREMRESRLVQRLTSHFDRRPFLTVWFLAWSPIPFWPARFLAPLAGYGVDRYLWAFLLGRFPKIWFFAALGLWWRPSDRLLLGILVASLVAGGAVWAYKRFTSGDGPADGEAAAAGGGGVEAPAAVLEWIGGQRPKKPVTAGAGRSRRRPRSPEATAAPEGDGGDVHVLYIAGKGRSGSTLLCRTLGEVDGCVAAGELMRIFGRGVTNGDLCSCGEPVPACSLWSDVLGEFESRAPELDPERIERLRDRVTEGREFLRYFFLPGRFPRLERRLSDYRRVLSRLYRSIRDVTGCPVVVDASKNAAYGRLLTETRGVSVSVVHLVRDSRGVAHSLSKEKVRPGTAGRVEHFEQRGPLAASTLWTAAQLLAESLRRRTARFVTVRYEDFVSSPRAVAERILELVGRSDGRGQLAHVGPGATLRLGVHHLIASNPNRSQRGRIELREDLEWRHEMSSLREKVVTGLTYPLLRRYGYLPGNGFAGGRASRGG